MTKAAQRWKTVSALRLRWRCWDDEYIVYNCNSGDAHLLNPVAAEALKALQKSAVSVEELTEQVGRCLDIETGDDLHKNIHHFVLKLARLGLVRPADDTF